MTYEQTLEFLYSQLPAYHRIGKAAYKNDLNNSIALDNYLNHPHLKYKTIHIAGTNGKGSVSHMIASVLQEAGYKTGLYTSPHLKDFRERIRVNGEMISEEAVVSFVTNHRTIIDNIKPSFFEMSVAMAFEYFAVQEVEVAVIEVGLGGRLDSTNIITPVLSLITNIGHDHMDLLGNTLEKIATEKAGIVKQQVPVIISETQSLVKDVFIKKADETDSVILFADEQYSCQLNEKISKQGERRYKITNLKTKKIYNGDTVLAGDYQSANFQAVLSVFNTLKFPFKCTDKNITDGIKKVVINTGLKGRWQIIGNKPLIICDTGHNKEGLEYVISQILRIKNTNLHMVIGFVNDKDLESVLPLFPKAATYYFTKAAVPRALDENLLRAAAHKYGLNGQAYPDVKTALARARKNAAKRGMIFIGGSTFIVAEVI